MRAPARDVGTNLFAGEHGFFEAQLLGVNEVPHRPIIGLEAARGELGHQPMQGEVLLPDPCQEPGVMLAPDRLRLVPAPIWPGAMLPVAPKRRTQAIPVLIPTPNCDAASRRDRPPFSTAPTTRSLRPTE